MQTRQSALHEWLKTQLSSSSFTLNPLAGDASFRRYFRLHDKKQTYVVMDAPPDKEGLDAFLRIAIILAKHGIRTPQIIAHDQQQGFVLLEDFGDRLLLNELTKETADRYYREAIQAIFALQQCTPSETQVPDFDRTYMRRELMLFQEWFVQAYLGITLTASDEALLDATFTWLENTLALQPQVLIHRDYHSRNIMILDTLVHAPSKLGIIDFQDAMRGPYTYDLVSLLKDCYIQWPRAQIEQWVEVFYTQSPLKASSLDEFIHGFDVCGIQRHLKVLGIFCRLHLRDHKSNYLNDLPLTFNYLMAALEGQPALQPFLSWLQTKIQQSFLEKHV